MPSPARTRASRFCHPNSATMQASPAARCWRGARRNKQFFFPIMKRYAAELLGTFGLVFAGTGAIIINGASNGLITHSGIALTFGLVVLAMIYTVGDISGAHLNPAVTVGFWAARRMPGREVFPYVTSQVFGAVLAS